MKSEISSFLLLFVAFMSGCAQAVIPETHETVDETEVLDPPEVEVTEEAECPVAVSVATCAITSPTCEDDQPFMRYLTHGAHDCEMEYPPKYCEYMGDVTCDGVTAGVWCCE